MALLKRAPAAPAGLPPLSDDPVVRRLDDALAVLREEHDNVANRLSFFRLQKELEAPELHRDNETSRRRLAQTRQQLKTAQAKLAAQPFPEREPIALDDALPAATRQALQLRQGDFVRKPKREEEIAELSADLALINDGIAAARDARADRAGDLSLEANQRQLPKLREASVAIYMALAAVADAVDAENAVIGELVAAGYEPLGYILRDEFCFFTERLKLGMIGSLKNSASAISRMRELLREQGRLP